MRKLYPADGCLSDFSQSSYLHTAWEAAWAAYSPRGLPLLYTAARENVTDFSSFEGERCADVPLLPIRVGARNPLSPGRNCQGVAIQYGHLGSVLHAQRILRSPTILDVP